MAGSQLINNEGAPDVGPLDPVKGLQVHFGDGAQGHDACGVNQYVNAAKRSVGFDKHLLHLSLSRHVSAENDGGAAGFDDGVGCFARCITVSAVVNEDVGAVAGEAKSGGPPDASGSAGDDDTALG
ncbi:hypothetical protein AAE021_12475 [Arthrobacter citreus]|uniref:Uncharacterized protein n=1 Tax=Arthrobacter citreus TaxID=1670 RepID=A0ABZ2ZS33_9MICC